MSTSTGPVGPNSVTVSFGERFQASEQFDAIFKEGMALVERTAAYLDGEGRAEAKRLGPPTSMVYATESMRLTTRLLELASWLLIRRSLKEGDITPAEAQRKRERIKLKTLGRPAHIRCFDDLPESLRELIVHSFSLQDRIIQLDRAMTQNTQASQEAAAEASPNPVAAQMSMLQQAFTR